MRSRKYVYGHRLSDFGRKWARKLDRLYIEQEASKDPDVWRCGSCGKVHAGSCAIPDAPLYVLANDTFMSGWGQAGGQINTVVVPCSEEIEARDVMRYLDSRSDMNRIRMAINKPAPRGRKLSLIYEFRYHGLGVEVPRPRKVRS